MISTDVGSVDPPLELFDRQIFFIDELGERHHGQIDRFESGVDRGENKVPLRLGGHLKTGHTWTLQNRPTKSRNSGQDLLYLGMLNSANIFCWDGHFRSKIDILVYTV